jgi:Domain of unknown function (DUF5666)/Domain of unknown function (DUF4382)
MHSSGTDNCARSHGQEDVHEMRNLRITALGAMIVLLACGLIACGGGSATSTTTSSSSAGALASSITIGDAPADNVVAFEITVNSITLTGASGSTTVLSTPRRLEMTHLSATVEHLSIGNIPSGNYTSASIAWSSPEVTFLNAAGAPVEVQSSSSGTATVNTSFTVSAASVLNFDIDVASSVSVNTAAGTATFNSPVFTFTAARGMGEVEREAETGEIEDMQATVTAASSTSVTVSTKSGNSMTFAVNASTALEGITSTAQLVANQVIRIEGTTQTDGTLLAKEIEAESVDGNGSEAEGLVTSVGATSFAMIVHDASGVSMSNSDLGKTISVDASTARFSIGKTKINTSGFAFSLLSDLHKGQRVEVDSDTPKSAGAGTVSDDGSMNGAKKIKLQQQALTGSVSGISGSNFTLTIPADSAFAKLAGTTSVQVVNNGAQLKNGATVSAGATVRVRGLLFVDAAGYHLVAGRITTP